MTKSKEIHASCNFVVKPSNIRIWIHDKDIAKLTRVLWSGLGFRLLNETSTHGKVKKFLENVPLVLNSVREIHQAVIDNNSDQLQFLLELPPPAIITTKDQNGLTVAHKAAGLGHIEILDFIIKTWPQGAKEVDKTGKTPLHWAVLAKDNINAIQEMLMQNFGVEEDVMDYKMKTPAYYKTKPQELEKSFLLVLPSAPRIQRNQVVDWGILEDDIGDLHGTRPTGKIVMEKKKKSLEKEDQDIDPDLEESANSIKYDNIFNEDEMLTNGNPHRGTLLSDAVSIENVDTTPNRTELAIGNEKKQFSMREYDEKKPKINIAPHKNSSSPLQVTNALNQESKNSLKACNEIDVLDTREMKEAPASSQEGSSDNYRIEMLDMEQLASTVLNGEGNKLLGARSEHKDIQEFLDNVPLYMVIKIYL
ncbi:uncharacterized protein LOC129612342 [Condylostylus longicornis]|uniref:uncharacterized protein LOC129612342 n=1 Tax=Condylostylus longicornis TaxID=2530218 RepID=UPI00244DBD50|nr:uncharacterized protein LOC129612342 [Condylostylus longicornis]